MTGTSDSSRVWGDEVGHVPYDRLDDTGSVIDANPNGGITALISQYYNSTLKRYEFSGNQDIDAALIGGRYTISSLTFSFPTSGTFYSGQGYPAGSEPSKFLSFNAQQQAAARYAIMQIASYTNLTFTETTETDSNHANLRFGQTSFADVYSAYANFPSSSKQAGDVWFGRTNQPFYETPQPGNWGQATVMHEIGHTMGLKHGHQDYTTFDLTGYIDANPNGDPRYGSAALPSNHDGQDWSLMTYRSDPGNNTQFEGDGINQPQTYMQNDIAAMQYLYGANFNTQSGDTYYSWNPNTGVMSINGIAQWTPTANKISMTLWDGNGNDTYDLSNYTTNLSIDLRPGMFSTFSIAQLVNHRAYSGGTALAAGNVANALLYQGDERSLIENANGGSGNDTMTGNQAANRLYGAGGNDILNGGLGNDTLISGAGSIDQLNGGDGNDMLLGQADRSILDGGIGDDVLSCVVGNDNILLGGDGVDRAEFFTATGALTVDLHYDPNDPTADYPHYQIAGIGGGYIAFVENVTCTAFADVVTGDNGDNILRGDAGNDALSGSDGNDTLRGEDDNDVLMGGAGVDTLDGGTGSHDAASFADQTLAVRVTLANDGSATARIGGLSDDVLLNIEDLIGGAGKDKFLGNLSANRLDGGDGNDELNGRGGADVLIGGAGKDTLIGGSGNDVFFFAAGSGKDVIADFTSGDAIRIDVVGVDSFSNLRIRDDGTGGALVLWKGGSIDLVGVDKGSVQASAFSFGPLDQIVGPHQVPKFADLGSAGLLPWADHHLPVGLVALV